MEGGVGNDREVGTVEGEETGGGERVRCVCCAQTKPCLDVRGEQEWNRGERIGCVPDLQHNVMPLMGHKC